MEAMMASRSKYDCLLFDMDDTLYPMSAGMNLACRKNIQDYMLHCLHMEESEVPKMCLDLYKEYGTTMAGLKALGYQFDDDEFHAYVHGRLPYDKLKPDPVLRNLLLSMPQRKIIFTNADRAHAAKVLSKLGLEDCFEGVICFETLNPPKIDDDDGANDSSDEAKLVDDLADSLEKSTPPLKSYGSSSGFTTDSESDADVSVGGARGPKSSILCKPNPDAMEAAIQIANVDPKRTIFFDDSARNIASGKAAGLHTVYVGSSVLVPGADFALESIHNIKEALPGIWQIEAEGQFEMVVPVETSVLA